MYTTLIKEETSNNPDAYPIYQQADARLDFLLNLHKWLKIWNCSPIYKNEGCLSRDTFLAFSLTLKVLVDVIRHFCSLCISLITS